MNPKFLYEVRVSVLAKKQLKQFSKGHRQAILEVLRELREDPFFGKPLTRELTGKFNLRVGVYRIIYKVNIKDHVVNVSAFDHRGKVYN